MLPDTNCYYCAGTGLAPDGWHDCPVCMVVDDDVWDDYDEDEEWTDDEEEDLIHAGICPECGGVGGRGDEDIQPYL